MTLQSQIGKKISRETRKSCSKPKARRVEALFDINQLTFKDFQDNE